MKEHFEFLCILIWSFSLVFVSILVISNLDIVTFQLHGQSIDNNTLSMNEGVASGDVSHNSTTIWARVDKKSTMNLLYDDNSAFLHPVFKTKWVDSTTDFARKIRIEDLIADTKYFYKVWFSDIGNNYANSSAIVGSFRTAPNLLLVLIRQVSY